MCRHVIERSPQPAAGLSPCVLPSPVQRTLFSGILFFLLARLDDMQLWQGRTILDANVRALYVSLGLPF